MSISKTSSAAVLPLFRSAQHDQLGANTYRSPSKAHGHVAIVQLKTLHHQPPHSSHHPHQFVPISISIFIHRCHHHHYCHQALLFSRSKFGWASLHQIKPVSLLTVTGPKVLWHIIVNDLSTAISHKRWLLVYIKQSIAAYPIHHPSSGWGDNCFLTETSTATEAYKWICGESAATFRY